MNVEYWAIPDHIRQKILKEIMRLEDTVTEQVFILHFLTKVMAFLGTLQHRMGPWVYGLSLGGPSGRFET